MALYAQTSSDANSGTAVSRFFAKTGIPVWSYRVDNQLTKGVKNLYENYIKPSAQNVASGVNDIVQSPVVQGASDKVKDVIDSVADDLVSGADRSRGATYSAARPVVNTGSTLDYKYADLAAHYGMDAKAAYSEALQNTAYERAVADLKRAGLNPVLAAGNVSPAGSFAAGNTLAYGSGSGSSGGYRAPGSAEHIFSPELYNIVGTVANIGGAIAGVKLMPNSPVLGASTGAMVTKQVAQSFMQLVDSAVRSSRK